MKKIIACAYVVFSILLITYTVEASTYSVVLDGSEKDAGDVPKSKITIVETDTGFKLSGFKLMEESSTAIQVTADAEDNTREGELDSTQRKKVAIFIKNDLPKGIYTLTKMPPEVLKHSSLNPFYHHYFCMVLGEGNLDKGSKIMNLRLSFSENTGDVQFYVEYPHAHSRGNSDDLTPSSTGGHSLLFNLKK